MSSSSADCIFPGTLLKGRPTLGKGMTPMTSTSGNSKVISGLSERSPSSAITTASGTIPPNTSKKILYSALIEDFVSVMSSSPLAGGYVLHGHAQPGHERRRHIQPSSEWVKI